MNKIQMMKLMPVYIPKVCRLTSCQFCVSNQRRTNVRKKSVFERYVESQMENDIFLDAEPKRHNNSTGTASEGLNRTRSLEQDNNSKMGIFSKNANVHENQTREDLKTIKSKVIGKSECNSVSNQETDMTFVKKNTESLVINTVLDKILSVKKKHGNDPLKFILNYDLVPNVNSDVSSEDYLLFHEQLEKACVTKLPSVSGVLRHNEGSNNGILMRWKQNQIREMGQEAFNKKMHEKKQVGNVLHQTINRYLSGDKNLEIAPNIQHYWKSVIDVLDSIKKEDVKLLEGHVFHPTLHYLGTYDCIALYRNTLCILEWKTSSKPKPFLSTTMNYPIQAAAYVGAVNASFDPDLKRLGPVTNAVLVVCYSNSQPAHAHYLNDKIVQVYWKQWLNLLHGFWLEKTALKQNFHGDKNSEYD